MMEAAIRDVHTLAIDSAPLIYFVERHPVFGPPIRSVGTTPRSPPRTVISWSAILRSASSNSTPMWPSAPHAGAQAFLTNDADLSRVSDLRVIQLTDLIER